MKISTYNKARNQFLKEFYAKRTMYLGFRTEKEKGIVLIIFVLLLVIGILG